VLVAFLAVLATAPLASAKSKDPCTFLEDAFLGANPVTTTEPPAASVLASYAVLRRPAANADQPPPINSLAEQVDIALGRYNPAYLRQLTQRPGGRRFFLVPGFPPHVEIPPARCLPRALRRQRPKLVEQQARRERIPVACIVTIDPNRDRSGSEGGESCRRFRDVTKYESLSGGLFESGEHAGILPDEIATVRVHFGDGPTVQVPVAGNFYLYKVDPAQRKKLRRQLRLLQRRFLDSPRPRTRARRRQLERRFFALTNRAIRRFMPTNIELLAADGHVVKNVKRSTGDAVGIGIPIAE